MNRHMTLAAKLIRVREVRHGGRRIVRTNDVSHLTRRLFAVVRVEYYDFLKKAFVLQLPQEITAANVRDSSRGI